MVGPPIPVPPATGTRHGRHGLVCSTDHLASGAGLALLRAGGSAADAAVAAAAVLGVTQPYQCGPGGDLFALVHDGGAAPQVLDAAGMAGSGADADAEALRAEGHRHVPRRDDVRAVTVPGCVDGWLALHGRFGRRPLAEVLAPAIDLAEGGFSAGPFLVALAPLLADVPGAEAVAAAASVAPGGLVRRPDLAVTLRELAAGGRDAFYRGRFGAALVALGAGTFTDDDLARPQARWTTPLSVEVWGHRVWTVPPPSQGYLALSAAWIAAQVGLPDRHDPAWAHLTVEAARQAGWDRPAVLSDRADGAALLAPERLGPRADAIDPELASTLPAPAASGDTVYLCALDDDRLGVSLIQSNASGFGAHLAAGDTGVLLHDRGLGFSLEPGHPAELGAGRRPPHTLAPLLVTGTDGSLRHLVGTMGGDAQPQVLLQLLARLLDAGQGPGPALRAARWVLASGSAPDDGFATWADPSSLVVRLEPHAPAGWADELARRGHRVQEAPPWDPGVGLAHAAEVGAEGTVGGASDPRAPEGTALAW